MSRDSAHPFFHPTTIVVVDDNQDYLVNFSLRLNENLAYRLFSSPMEALEWVNDYPASNALLDKCFVHRSDDIFDVNNDNLIQVNVDVLKDELGNRQRFTEKSVVIVDYDMPGMSGIEFCRLIRDPNVKKILLTGVADEKLAVKAFNEGVIDKFIMKQDGDSVSAINDFICEFQNAYFEEKGGFLKNALPGDAFGFLLNNDFLKLFKSLRCQHEIIEYYLTSEPIGYMMLNAKGLAMQLIVFSSEEMRAHSELVKGYQGPDELYQLINRNEVIPYFWQHGGYYSPEVKNWRNYIYPCHPIDKVGHYFYAIVEDADYFSTQLQSVFRYSDYLESLDDES